MKNKEKDIEVINALTCVKEYCAEKENGGDCFCCMMFGFCHKHFKGVPAFWKINNPYEKEVNK